MHLGRHVDLLEWLDDHEALSRAVEAHGQLLARAPAEERLDGHVRLERRVQRSRPRDSRLRVGNERLRLAGDHDQRLAVGGEANDASAGDLNVEEAAGKHSAGALHHRDLPLHSVIPRKDVVAIHHHGLVVELQDADVLAIVGQPEPALAGGLHHGRALAGGHLEQLVAHAAAAALLELDRAPVGSHGSLPTVDATVELDLDHEGALEGVLLRAGSLVFACTPHEVLGADGSHGLWRPRGLRAVVDSSRLGGGCGHGHLHGRRLRNHRRGSGLHLGLNLRGKSPVGLLVGVVDEIGLSISSALLLPARRQVHGHCYSK
mmetsp:Transcript_15477/g.60513  ORF Transcript_15477/g.60513 Transcript_15477/m.60513 type:complete len:318 (-) Transcript_15477:44-997(-)